MIQVFDGDGECFESLLRVTLRYVEFKRRDDEVPEKGGRKYEMWFSKFDERDEAYRQLSACVTRVALVSLALKGGDSPEHESRLHVTRVDELQRTVGGWSEYGVMLTGVDHA